MAAAIVLVIGANLFFAYLGYYGGPLYTDLRGSDARPRAAVVLLSGDLGFRIGMAPQIAAKLAADGADVVGINTLTYLRDTRTPADMTRLIARAMHRAMALGHTDRVVLVGQSFGADMLHVGLATLPADLRARVSKVALIVPEDNVQFRASPGEIFDYATRTYPALPTAVTLGWVPTLCIQGVEERDSLCPLLTQRNVRRVALPGGHPLHRDADTVYRALSPFVFG